MGTPDKGGLNHSFMAQQDLHQWITSQDYSKQGLDITPSKFIEVSDLLLERPNLNSSHLFRADILYDSTRQFQTLSEKEQTYGVHVESQKNGDAYERLVSKAPDFTGYVLERAVLRRLIPRNPQLDQPLEQSCFIYHAENGHVSKSAHRLVVYLAHVKFEEDMPWYHPAIKMLAYKYERTESASISIHYLPFTMSNEPTPTRLHRTFMSLLNTIIRLAKLDKPGSTLTCGSSETISSTSLKPSALKDTILPQHIVQDTYACLKQKYAADLIGRWIENTEPSKHVFEDISIAAFLIELWKQMYKDTFPGFIDMACGNGVLVYILIKEGYHGRGFDARRRKTWEVLEIDEYLEEKICIPKPFYDTISNDANLSMPIHTGMFAPGTFIISNHADELTPWTPILAALSSPELPLPFLAIPCCSHALSGARYRYTLKEIDIVPTKHNSSEDNEKQNPQPPTGDLKALRVQKANAANHQDDKSQYACLTKKVSALAMELGIGVELTLIRIPSTRNIGIIGNRKVTREHAGIKPRTQNANSMATEDTMKRITTLLQRECSPSGGIQATARAWTERAKSLQTGRGRGKVNLGAKPDVVAHEH